MNRPSVSTSCPADKAGARGASERIVEVTFPNGDGCLIRLYEFRGRNIIEVYRADPSIMVDGPGKS